VYEDFRNSFREYFESLLDNTSYVKAWKEKSDELKDRLVKSDARLRLSFLELDRANLEAVKYREGYENYKFRVADLETILKSKDGLIGHLKIDQKEKRLLINNLIRGYAQFMGKIIENTSLNKYPGAIIDRNGNLIYVTPSMKKLFYKSEEEVEGRNCLSFFDVGEVYRNAFDLFYNNPQAREVEIISKIPHGQKKTKQGIVFSKISSPAINLYGINVGKDELVVPVCTYVTARRSRAVLVSEVEKVRNKFRGAIKEFSENHDPNFSFDGLSELI